VQYTYYVMAVDAAGNRSNASNQLLVTPNLASLGVTVNGQLSPGIIGLPGQDITAPTVPTNLTAATAALTATTSSVTLSWNLSTDNTAVSGYEIYRGGVKIATVAAPGYTDPSVASASTYNYFVMAIDAAGNRSAASSPLAVTPTTASLGVTFNGQLSSSILGL
jgi:chitin-binding protein